MNRSRWHNDATGKNKSTFYLTVMYTARSIIIGELRFFFARRGLNGCLGRLGHACRVLLGRGNHLHNPDLVGTK